MELDDCAFPTLAGVEIGDDANTIFNGVNLALLVGARPRGPGMERGDLLEANGGIFAAAGQGPERRRGRRHPRHGDRQPGQHQRPHRDEQRARHPPRALLGPDASRPQPRDLAARGQARRAGHRDQEDDDLGQPLRDAVPRPVPRRGLGQERRRDGRTTRTGWRTPSSRPSPSAARRSSRPVARRPQPRPPRRRSTTPAPGRWAPPRATGSRCRSAPTAPTACPRASSPRSRSPSRTAEWEIVQGLEIDDFSRGKIDASVAGARGGARRRRGLGLIELDLSPRRAACPGIRSGAGRFGIPGPGRVSRRRHPRGLRSSTAVITKRAPPSTAMVSTSTPASGPPGHRRPRRGARVAGARPTRARPPARRRQAHAVESKERQAGQHHRGHRPPPVRALARSPRARERHEGKDRSLPLRRRQRRARRPRPRW